MRRYTGTVISGWPAILFAPILAPLALIAGIAEYVYPSPGEEMTPEEVLGYIEDLINCSGGDWDWDHFEHTKFKDPVLNGFRQRATRMGPPHADVDGLRLLANEMRVIFPELGPLASLRDDVLSVDGEP